MVCTYYVRTILTYVRERVLAHSAEAIQIKNGYGLGVSLYQTEEGLKALYKLVRRWRETRARKCNLLDNIKDVFVH